MRFVFIESDFDALRTSLLGVTDRESCAIALARVSSMRLVVHDIRVPADEDYLERTVSTAVLRPEFLHGVTSAARRSGSALIFIHTHPKDTGRPKFSNVDDTGELRLRTFLNQNLPWVHGAMVVAPGGVSARLLGEDTSCDVISVGDKLRFVTSNLLLNEQEIFDRQIRAFGADGQAAIAGLKVGIVGLGGTGSLTVQQLAHLGVQDFTIIDFDRVDETSLNRLVGATASDVGSPKVTVAAQLIASVRPNSIINPIIGNITDDKTARALLDRDLIFGCTDSHASRAILGQIAYQYLIPVLDLGVSLSVRDGQLAKITGRSQILSPTQPCFTCLDLLNSEQIRRELLTPEQRLADRYIDGAQEPQPSVISLNATMSALSITMFLGLVTEAPISGGYLRYDGIKGQVRPATGVKDANCYVCSANGSLTRGDTWQLPTRPSQL